MRRERISKRVELVLAVAAMVTVSTVGAYAQSGKSSTLGVSGSSSGLLMKQSTGEFRPVQEALKESQAKIPDDKSTTEEWTTYFKTQLEEAGKITDSGKKMARLAEITSDLVTGLMNGANISVDSVKAVLGQVTSFINSDAFKKLAESTNAETQNLVSIFLTIAQDTMNSAVKKYGDKLDQATVTGLKDALKKYESKILQPGTKEEGAKTVNLPAMNAKAEEWTNYFKTQLEAAGKTTDSKEKMNQLAMLAGDLGFGLSGGANITADTAKSVLAQVTSFINSDAFKKLAESADAETKQMVSAFLTTVQAGLDSAKKKFGDKLDQATVTGLTNALKTYQDKIQQNDTTSVKRPDNNASAEEWTKYFKSQLEAVNKLADPQAKFQAWNALISDLGTALKNGVNISADTLKEMVNQVSAYINSDAFKKLDISKDDKLKQQVADFIDTAMDTLKTAIEKSPDKLDKKRVTAALTALESFFGTKGFEMGSQFAALPKEQKERLMNSYVALGKKILETKSGSIIDADVKTQVAGDLSKLLTTQMRELFRNKDYKIDITSVKKEVVNALCSFVKSDDFKKLSEAQQKSVIGNARYVAVELIWRPENNAENKEYVNQMAGLFKTTIDSAANTQVKAYAVNQVTDIFRIANWRNKDVAGSFLKEAFNVKGGVKGVVDELLKAAGEQKDANLRGEIAVAMSNLLYHANDIEKNCGYKIDADTTTKLTKNVTDYMKGVNDGSIKASGGTRNSVLHIAGSVVSKSISDGTAKTGNKDFNDAYIALAKGSLLLKKEDGGSVGLQTTVINKLNAIKEAAEKKKETALADQAKAVLLDKNFDVAAYLKEAQATVQSLVGIKADSGSWYVQGMTNIGKIQLQNSTGNLNADQTKGILSSGKEWITGKYNLKDMRLMAWQSAMFRQMFNFAKEIYKKDSKVYTEEQKKEYEAYFKAIFAQIATLDDPLVKEQAIAAAKDLAAYLKQSGQEALIARLGLSSYVS